MDIGPTLVRLYGRDSLKLATLMVTKKSLLLYNLRLMINGEEQLNRDGPKLALAQLLTSLQCLPKCLSMAKRKPG